MASSLGLVHPALPTRTASASPLPRQMDFRSLKGQARVWGRSLPTPSCAEAPLCPLRAGEGQGPGWFLAVPAPHGQQWGCRARWAVPSVQLYHLPY